jgi:hypothetical protein
MNTYNATKLHVANQFSCIRAKPEINLRITQITALTNTIQTTTNLFSNKNLISPDRHSCATTVFLPNKYKPQIKYFITHYTSTYISQHSVAMYDKSPLPQLPNGQQPNITSNFTQDNTALTARQKLNLKRTFAGHRRKSGSSTCSAAHRTQGRDWTGDRKHTIVTWLGTGEGREGTWCQEHHREWIIKAGLTAPRVIHTLIAVLNSSCHITEDHNVKF